MTKLPWLKPSEALNRPIHRQADNSVYTALEQIKVTRRLGFHVGNLGLLIAQGVISELTDNLPICQIPNTAVWLLGLINLRGNLIPVFNLNKLLGFEQLTTEKKKTMLLILGEGETAGAIAIEGLPVHLTFTDNDKLHNLPLLPEIIRPFVSHGFEKNGQLWFNFDHLGFFGSLANKVAV